jgi:phage portal protein BeeE
MWMPLVRRRKAMPAVSASWVQPPFWAPSEEIAPAYSLPMRGAEQAPVPYEAYARHIALASGPIAAAMFVRQLVFAEARFGFVRFEQGRRQDLFTTAALDVLERPWPGATTADLLVRMEQHVTLAGNAYVARVGDRLVVLRPDRVRLVIGSRSGRGDQALDAEVVAVAYDEGDGRGPTLLLPDDVAHYAPLPDPVARWRGMSWITPVLREVQADQAATRHKLGFFQRGATPGIVVTYDATIGREEFEAFVETFRERFEGSGNAYRTLHLGGGADVKPLTMDFSQLDFARLVGRAETRIAAAAGVHPVILGFSEGLQGSSLNAGNYLQVRRRFVDGTMRPLWRQAAAALERVVDTPDGAHLWYDDRDIGFLRQDVVEEARIRQMDAQTIVQLVREGFDPGSAIDAVINNDMRRLRHTGLLSVQLQPQSGNGVRDGNREPVGRPS